MLREQILREESLLVPDEADPRLLARPRRRWSHVLRSADRARPELRRLALRAFTRMREDVRGRALAQALEDRDQAAVLRRVDRAVAAGTRVWAKPVRKLLLAVVERTGTRAGRLIPRARRAEALRAAAPEIRSWKFDVTNPRAQEWAEKHAAELVDEVNKTTRKKIHDLIERSFSEQIDPRDIADEIENLIGDEERAETIARTETMRAANQGQLEAWEQAVEAGLLTGNERKEWIVTPDDRLCPICEPMDGETADLDGDFNVDGERIDAPPAHPRCRCTMGIAREGS